MGNRSRATARRSRLLPLWLAAFALLVASAAACDPESPPPRKPEVVSLYAILA